MHCAFSTPQFAIFISHYHSHQAYLWQILLSAIGSKYLAAVPPCFCGKSPVERPKANGSGHAKTRAHLREKWVPEPISLGAEKKQLRHLVIWRSCCNDPKGLDTPQRNAVKTGRYTDNRDAARSRAGHGMRASAPVTPANISPPKRLRSAPAPPAALAA